MARVTSVDVEEILDDPPSKSLDPFIQAATTLIDSTLLEQGLSDDLLFEIERWLSAHFYHVMATRLDKEKIDDSDRTKRSKVDMGLNLTHYGQQAMILDISGTLQTLDMGPGKFQFAVISHDSVI